jgi:cellulose synthase/poly-beta-1,6-N-acetylglucosamine synthase-like glycosyltransferase
MDVDWQILKILIALTAMIVGTVLVTHLPARFLGPKGQRRYLFLLISSFFGLLIALAYGFVHAFIALLAGLFVLANITWNGSSLRNSRLALVATTLTGVAVAYLVAENLFAQWPQSKVVIYSLTAWALVSSTFMKDPPSRN